MKFKNSLVGAQVHDRDFRDVTGSLAANAGSTAVLSIDIPINTLVVVEARIKTSAGTQKGVMSGAADASNQIAITAHGLVTGDPVFASGTGLTATTIYYVNAVNANTLKVYDTRANAVAGAGTGTQTLTNLATYTITPTVDQSYYMLRFGCRNRNGNVSLLGAVNQVIVLEDVAALDATAVADNSNKRVDIKITPDATLATRYQVVSESFSTAVTA